MGFGGPGSRLGLVAVVSAFALGAAALASAPAVSSKGTRVALASTDSPAGVVQAATGGRRPNIILITLDDMRADDLRFAPNTRAHIRDRGLDFRNSFAPYPLCCPARASFLLGKYAHNHRVLYHDAPYGFGSLDDRTTIATRLRNAGYQTGFVGKYLNRYGIQRSRVTGGSSVRYVPRGWTDWMAGLDDGWGGSGGTYSFFNFTQNVNGRVVYNRGRYSSNVIADQARNLISRYHRRSAPFFLWLNPVAPHFGGPAEPDDPRPVRMSNGQLLRLKTPARPGWVKGRFNGSITRAPGIRRDGGPSEGNISDKPRNIRRWPEPRPVEKRGLRDLHRQRAESIFAWDREFGRIVTRLKRTGEYRDTIFMFTSDNGYFLGEHRIRQGKIRAHEPSLRVPFVVAGPGILRGVRFSPITTFDVTATILDAARAYRLPDMDGASRLGRMTGKDTGWTTPVVTEGLLRSLKRNVAGFPRGLTVSGLRTGRYKLTRYATGEGELYDLVKDPNELSNLFSRPSFRPVRDQMIAAWKKYRSCSDAQCRAALPVGLQTSRADLIDQYRRSVNQYNAHFN